MRSDGRIENLSGSWATFERGGDYKLRGVDAALKELTTAVSPKLAIAPVCPTMDTPLAAEKATSSFAPPCVTPTPTAVTITGVELGLLQAQVFEDGQARLHLVPAYRFLGHFDNGTPWETSVIALHPDAIAPPPDLPAGNGVRDGGGSGIGKSVPPTPPSPETGG
jgi:hypothetical protein